MTPKDWRALDHAWKSARHSRETGNQHFKAALRIEVKEAIRMVADRLREIVHGS